MIYDILETHGFVSLGGIPGKKNNAHISKTDTCENDLISQKKGMTKTED